MGRQFTEEYYTISDPIDCHNTMSLVIKARDSLPEDSARRAQRITDRTYSLWLQKGPLQGHDSKGVEKEFRHIAKINGTTIHPDGTMLIGEIPVFSDKKGQLNCEKLPDDIAALLNKDWGFGLNVDVQNKIIALIETDCVGRPPVRPSSFYQL